VKSSRKPANVVLTLVGVIDEGQTASLCGALRACLQPDGNEVVTCDARRAVACFGLVGALARLQLIAHEHGNTIRITGVRNDVRVLIDLAGLADVLLVDENLRSGGKHG
jgi:ABC-type transporter Mla MlaB component